MTLIRSTDHLITWRSSVLGQTIALVPTMGALHSGHIALIKHAAQQCDVVVVSVFVNAMQFGKSSDFDQYPRSLDTDHAASIAAGATIVFAPSAADMFPANFDNYITPSTVADDFEGASRPGHFAGVVTVVNRLFDLVEPHIAIFGAKDYQQVVVIRDMTRALHPSIEIQRVETIRDTDGLALSSRNARLSPSARKSAKVIADALSRLHSVFQTGQVDSSVLKQTAHDVLQTQPDLTIEYLEIVDSETLKRQDQASQKASVVLFAGIIDEVRLIDNIELQKGSTDVDRHHFDLPDTER
jgi:pantoate--beta-alanine ligase